MSTMRGESMMVLLSLLSAVNANNPPRTYEHVTDNIDESQWQQIRIKVHYLESWEHSSHTAKEKEMFKETVKIAASRLKRIIKVNPAKHPILIPRVCLHPLEERRVVEYKGRPRILCKKGCVRKPVCNVMPFPDEHLDDCYTYENGNGSFQDHPNKATLPNFYQYHMGNSEGGVGDHDFLLYIDLFPDESHQEEHVRGAVATASPCYFDPLARNRPTAGYIELLKSVILSDVGTGTDAVFDRYGWDYIVDTIMHEALHLFGYAMPAIPLFWKSAGGTMKPWSLRSPYFPYCPLFWSLTVLNYTENSTACHDGTHYLYWPGGVLRMSENRSHEFDYVAPHLKKAAAEYFKCKDIEVNGFKLYNEHFRRPTTAFNHFKDAHFYPEPMTSHASVFIYGFLTEITAALLKDTGWYQIDDTLVVKPYGYGQERGCDLANLRCAEYIRRKKKHMESTFPLCEEERDTWRCSVDRIGKTMCMKHNDQKCFIEQYIYKPQIKQARPYVSHHCWYSGMDSSKNVLWEKLHFGESYCFDPAVCNHNSTLDVSTVKGDVPSDLSSDVRKLINQKFQPACFKVDCDGSSRGKPKSYTVHAQKGEPQVCHDETTVISFTDGDKVVGPFLCNKYEDVCSNNYKTVKDQHIEIQISTGQYLSGSRVGQLPAPI